MENMSTLQAYYNEFRCGHWADHDPDVCLCHGSGWALSDVDTWHECPVHYAGQLHPEVACDCETEEEYEAMDKASRAEFDARNDTSPMTEGNRWRPLRGTPDKADAAELLDDLPF